jgi:hypothetical protein
MYVRLKVLKPISKYNKSTKYEKQGKPKAITEVESFDRYLQRNYTYIL